MGTGQESRQEKGEWPVRLQLQAPRSHFTRELGIPERCFLGVMWSGLNAREPSRSSGASWRPRVLKDAGNEWEPQEACEQTGRSVYFGS